MNITDVQDAHARLGKLLEDPQPGLSSWHESVRRLVTELAGLTGINRVQDSSV